MKHHTIPRVVAKQLIPLILLFALYVQFHGDYGPGGGFQAGVIFAAGVVLYGLIFGLEAARRVIGERTALVLMGVGLALYIGVGVAGMLLGGTFLDYGALDHHDPKHGQHVGILAIELGVGITVTATMVSIFYAFAGRGRPR